MRRFDFSFLRLAALTAILPCALFAAPVAERFGGTGIQLFRADGFPQVMGVIPGTPAESAGLRPGDRLEYADGFSLEGLTLDEAVELLRGEAGTELELTVVRDGEPLTVKMTRVKLDVRMAHCADLRRDRGIDATGSDLRAYLGAGKDALIAVDAKNISDSDEVPASGRWGVSVALPDRQAANREARRKAAAARSAEDGRVHTIDGRSWSDRRVEDAATPVVR